MQEMLPYFVSAELACGLHDARCIAARLHDAWLQRYPDQPVTAFGTADTIGIGLGASSECIVHASKTDKTRAFASTLLWQKLAAYLDDNKGRYISGYIGFDAGKTGILAHMLCPETVVKVSRGSDGLSIATSRELPENLDIAPCACTKGRFTSAISYDNFSAGDFLKSIESVIDWIGGNPKHRLTLARTVSLPSVSLSATLVAQKAVTPLQRSYLIKTASAQFCGHSPELLATGSSSQFSCYKLSGTASNDQASHLAMAATHDRIHHEHRIAIESIRSIFSRMGSVNQGATKELVLPELTHLLSRIQVRPRMGTTIAQCLEHAMPCGGFPSDQIGILLDRVEGIERGPYYGLVGMIHPDSSFEFSQTLRGVFHEDKQAIAWAGAAITIGSTPAIEYEETRLKLANIKFALT